MSTTATLFSLSDVPKFNSRSLRLTQVVKMALQGRSALAILPTGIGKSLCYQLPALVLPGLCLVVSPLIALMRDQLERLPACLPGAMLASHQVRNRCIRSQVLHHGLVTPECRVSLFSLCIRMFVVCRYLLDMAGDSAHSGCCGGWPYQSPLHLTRTAPQPRTP